MNNKIFLYLVCCCLLICKGAEATNLHIVLVADTWSNLSEQAQADLRSMTSQTKQLAETIGNAPIMHIITGERVNRPSVLNTIDRLPIAHDDLVFFYFSGHGCRTHQKISPWPYLYFVNANQYMALDEVVEHLKAKHPRFGVIMADCCNNFEGPMPENQNFNFQTLNYRRISPYIKNLFAKSRGLLVISGSEPGEFSWASEEGGILTCAFLDGLSQTEFHPSKTWDQLMGDIRRKTRGIQSPQYALIESSPGEERR